MHKQGVTISIHNSGQKNLHVRTSNGETSIKNVDDKSNRTIVIKDKTGKPRN